MNSPTPPYTNVPKSIFLRAWLTTPDWVFRALGAGIFLTYVITRMKGYLGSFPDIGPYWTPPTGDGARSYFPTAKILADLTFLLIALSFCFRIPPRKRAATAREILIPMIAGFWPLFPFMGLAILQAASSEWAVPLQHALDFGAISYERFLIGVILLTLGNGLDVWGYAVLFRSFSIVAEARVLKVTGPYRFVRHPVYLGQLLAQAGIWVVLLKTHLVWIAFYAGFVGIQLYRARIEDDVLAKAFGEPYLNWKRRTLWLP